MYIIAATTFHVDLELIFLLLGILAVGVVGTLLTLVLLKLNRTMSRVDKILKNKQTAIEQTLGNLPDMTENISEASLQIKQVASSVGKITGKAEGAATAVQAGGMIAKITMIMESAKRGFDFVTKLLASRFQDPFAEEAVEDIVQDEE